MTLRVDLNLLMKTAIHKEGFVTSTCSVTHNSAEKKLINKKRQKKLKIETNDQKKGIVIFGKGFNSILVLDEKAQSSFSKQSIFHSYFKF